MLALLGSPRRGRSFSARAAAPLPPSPSSGNARPPAPWPTGLRKPGARPAPEPLVYSSGGREGRGQEKAAPGFPPPSHSRPARRPPCLRIPAPARNRPRALLPRKHNSHTPSPGPGSPFTLVDPSLLRKRRRPSPTPLPGLSGPHQNVCSTRRRGQPPGRPQLSAEKSGPRRGGGGGKG